MIADKLATVTKLAPTVVPLRAPFLAWPTITKSWYKNLSISSQTTSSLRPQLAKTMTCTLFFILLVIQVSTAADRRTSSTATSPFSTLDMGAGTSFFRSVSGCRVRLEGSKNAVERPVRLAGGKPGLVVTTLLVEFYGPKCKLHDALHYISTKIIRRSSLF